MTLTQPKFTLDELTTQRNTLNELIKQGYEKGDALNLMGLSWNHYRRNLHQDGDELVDIEPIKAFDNQGLYVPKKLSGTEERKRRRAVTAMIMATVRECELKYGSLVETPRSAPELLRTNEVK